MESLYTPEHVKKDLLPLMEQYGTRTDTVPLPENVYPMALETYSGEMPEGLKMLDPAGSLEIPLEEHPLRQSAGRGRKLSRKGPAQAEDSRGIPRL